MILSLSFSILSLLSTNLDFRLGILRLLFKRSAKYFIHEGNKIVPTPALLSGKIFKEHLQVGSDLDKSVARQVKLGI